MGSLMRGWLRGTQSSIRALTYCQARSIRSSAPVLSNENKKLDEEAVVLTDDGRVVVCWHPEVPVPYELTKPIPAEAMPTDATLKVQALMPAKELFRRKNEQMVIDELMQLTHTSKYAWLPKRRRQRYREMDPLKEKRDREYL